MPKVSHPRRGSMQFWPRKRSKHSLVRVRSWATESKPKILGFIGFKAGMTITFVDDNRAKSMTKGENIALPVTIIDCPPLSVCGVAFYRYSRKIASFYAPKVNQNLSEKMPLAKKQPYSFEKVPEFDDLRLLVNSQPWLASTGTKKPKVMEIALGGNKDSKLAFAKEKLGKEIAVTEVFETGQFVDLHAVTKGKGFQGTVKRFGVPIRQHKAEKTKRGIATLGPWHPNRIAFTVPQPGKMGFHLRTEYNKQILKLSDKGEEVNPAGGLLKYGLVKNPYLLIKGSVAGPKKRALVLTQALRPNKMVPKEAFQVTGVRTQN